MDPYKGARFLSVFFFGANVYNDSCMKRKIPALILTYLVLFAVVAGSVFAIYYSSKIHWFFAIFVVMICILLVLAVLWYAIKITSDVKGIKRNEKLYSAYSFKVPFQGRLTPERIGKTFPSESYKTVRGEENGVKYSAYLKKNEAENRPNLIVVTSCPNTDAVTFDGIVNEILSVHDVPAGSSKTLVVVEAEKVLPFEENLHQLNSPHNTELRKFHVLYSLKDGLVTIGGYNELLSSNYVNSMTFCIQELFSLKEGK